MDVTLHYRPHQSNLPHLMKITQHLLTEFPTRPLPTFKPWFSCNGTFLKPAKAPPLISSKEADHISQLYITQEPVSVPGNNDWIMNLPEFCPMVKWKQKQEILRALSADDAHSVDEDSKSTKGLLRRAWSVSAPRGGLVKTNGTLSKELSSTLERLNLHCLHRAKWIIDDFNCNVMRLTKPTLFTNVPVTCEDRDLPGDLFDHLLKEDPSTVKGAELLNLGEMLTLPQNFGNIFLGETFSSYISVHNDSSQVVKDIVVKADLQTSSQRLNLSASNAAVSDLKPDCCIDDVIHHEVKEIGTHILVCAVSYTTQTGEKMYFRKFFKFQVLKPLDVKTKFYNAESDLSSVTDEVFLEAQIQNITTSPMFMEKVSLEPSIMYSVTELNAVNKGDEGISTFGKMTYLQPMDTRQYLYSLKPKPEFAEKAGVIKGVTVIGKLDIVWKTNLGERGRLQTSQLQRMAPGYGDVRLSLEAIPDTVNLEEPFDITCKITNCSERTMDLVLEMCNTNSIHWCGVSGRQLGKLSPSSSLHLSLKLLTSVQGLQSVSGLRLTDTFLKRTYEYDDIAHVCVVSSHLKPES
ncbi:trafficking protein particle complex subunit 13 isoform X2 [Protopterus annectens]|uniref:trafficking protein particle complex subunit 13 isoform X2 n=1 Tax=Protopterus annectens TaxID=7888 RepID=UPI001CF9540C|nr:trafficking protein particle complex subunit 13 isoform X2 [Protopterus annectens]